MSSAPLTAIHRRVAALRDGREPSLIARLPSGWAVLGDPQVIVGYCLLLPDPVVPHLNALAPGPRAEFLLDLGRLGDALLAVTGAARINYAIFGNQDPALHAHLFPRRSDEPAALVTLQPWAWDWERAPRFSAAVHAPLIASIAQALHAAAAC